jgi:hypothetical protein
MAVVFWAVTRVRWAAVRWVAAGLLLTGFLTGAVLSWRYTARTHYDLASYERALAQAPPGATVVVPINPPGSEMALVKR